jgi:RNA polymerase sigma-70 factor (ECF subfamily)
VATVPLGVIPTAVGTVPGRDPIVEGRPADARSGGAAPSLLGSNDEWRLLERLRGGDESAFVALLDQHGPSLRRLARTYASESIADDVVQETWIAAFRGLDGYEGRASLRTWLVRILINIARGRAAVEGRQVPFSAFAVPTGQSEPSVHPDRFRPVEGEWSGHWISYPRRWDEQPEERFLSSEGVDVALAAIDSLPPAQQEVVTLRDVEGWSSDEVSQALGISQGNQRVLLHRGRSKVRAALELAIVGRARTDGVLP